MTDAELLKMTKSNLQIAGSTWDAYLGQLIEAAKEAIARQGITLDVSKIGDCNLIVMYASYLYRKRADDKPVMPRMLRYELNNRLFAEKTVFDILRIGHFH
jgi:hypothetical protein